MVGYTVATTRPCNVFQCSSDGDCSGNGACDLTSSTCKCSSGYSGPSCNIRLGPCGSAPAPGPSHSAPAPAPPSPSGLPELCCETGIVDHLGNCCESGAVPVASLVPCCDVAAFLSLNISSRVWVQRLLQMCSNPGSHLQPCPHGGSYLY